MKVLTSWMKDETSEAYEKQLHDEQHGSRKGRGTDYACHTSRSIVDYAKRNCLSLFCLFIDLSKAIDKVIREILLAWPQGYQGDFADKCALLTSYGLSSVDAIEMATWIDSTGGLLKLHNVDERVTELIRSLHTSSWFQYGSGGKGDRRF